MNEDLQHVKEYYEKKLFDLQQLLEISQSLNSTLDYTILMDSILYTVMGQMHVLKVGLFAKKAIDHDFFSLYRNFKGFDIDYSVEYIIPETSRLIQHLLKNKRCFSLDELFIDLGETSGVKVLKLLDPLLVVPLISKGNVNGLIVLGDRIDKNDFSEEEREYLLHISEFAAIAIQNAFLFEMTTTDMMTQLRLRHYFYATLIDHIDKALNENIPLSVIMMDIDNFKNLNDTYGHTFGDVVLKQLAMIVRHNIRQIDVAARYGGEEFVVLLPQAGVEEAHQVAERIRKAIASEKFKFEECIIRTTISLGIAQFNPKVDHETESIIKRADKALYRSKHNGKNQTSVAE